MSANKIESGSMGKEHVPRLITGVHRSGTTWLGRTIDATGLVDVLHEPLNPQFGMAGVPCWYPYHPGGLVDSRQAPFAKSVENLFRGFFEGNATYMRSNVRGSIFRKVAKRAFGGSAEWTYRRAFARKKSICLKDPFSLFCVPFLVEKYDARVVIVVRHPAALLLSMRRMGWKPHLNSLIRQPGIFGDIGIPQVAHPWVETGNDVVSNGLFWKVAHRWVRYLMNEFPDKVVFVRHEDLCLGERDSLDAILSHLRLEAGSDAAWSFANDSMQGKTVIPEPGVLHRFSRDARSLAAHWKIDVPAADIRKIESIAYEELQFFY